MDQKTHDKGLEIRKAVLGEAYVANALRTPTISKPFQELVTEYCWGAIWGREELPRKTRTCSTSMDSILNRPHELRVHIKARWSTASARTKSARFSCRSPVTPAFRRRRQFSDRARGSLPRWTRSRLSECGRHDRFLSAALLPGVRQQLQLALMLTLCGQTFDPIWTIWRRDHADGGVAQMPSTDGEIPVLEEDGSGSRRRRRSCFASRKRYGKFGGADSDQRRRCLRWLFWDNHKLTGYMASYRYMRSFIEQPDPTIMTFFRKRLDDYLGIVENHLSRRSYVAGQLPLSLTSR